MKPIPGHEAYSITEDGRIWSHFTDKFMRATVRHNAHGLGYNYVGLIVSLDPKRYKYYYVHQLVMKTYVGECPVGLEVNHIDLNPGNNHVSNLRYVTHKENIKSRRPGNQYLTNNGQVPQ